MARQPETFTPSMSDAAVKAKTGKEWDDWFVTLDHAGAARKASKAGLAKLQAMLMMASSRSRD